MYNQVLHRVADAGALDFRIECDVGGTVEIGVSVDVGGADALVMFDHRHPRVLSGGPNQPRAAARNHHIHVILLREQRPGRFPVRAPNELDRGCGDSSGGQFLGKKVCDD